MEELEGMSVMSVINLMPERKEQIKEFNRQLKCNLMGGYVEPLKLLAQLKSMEKCLSEFLKDKEVSDVFLDSMQGDKNRQDYGCLFEVCETGVSYEYNVSSEWSEIEDKIKALRDEQKLIETRLKTASAKTPIVDSVSGELIYGIQRSSRTIVKTTLK